MPKSDDIGDRGESIFQVRITNYVLGGDPLFRPVVLGAKYPTLDFFVELLGLPSGQVAYFFAQVKATSRGYTRRPPERLKVSVSQGDIDRMLSYPGPTYVVGIDQTPDRERAFIAAVSGPSMSGIQGLTTRYPLNPANLRTLWEEVAIYWSDNRAPFTKSAFTIEGRP